MSYGTYDPTKKEGANQRPKRFYLKPGSNLYRILPPVKSLADKNKIAQYWSVIWLKDTRNKSRPVSSILRKKDGQVVQADPLIEKLEAMKAELTSAISRNENQAVLNMLKENLNRVRNNKGYYLNVLTASNELGVLEIPYTSYQNLDQRLTELWTQGIDAIGVGADKGVFFDFKKLKDERQKTVYPVDVATKAAKDSAGNFVMHYIRSPLSEEEASRLLERAEDLTQLYNSLSFEEMEALATLDQRVFDAIFMKSKDVEPANEDAVDDETKAELGLYRGATAATNLGVGQGVVTQAAPVQTATVRTAQPTTQPTATIGMPMGQSAANNEKVRNFLFPDKK
jgi:hypothetical protein